MNRAHLDDLSPAVQLQDGLPQDSGHACPLCPSKFSGLVALQSHFAGEHAADLSPTPQQSRGRLCRSPTTTNSSSGVTDRNGNCRDKDINCCPVCAESFWSDDPNVLQAHVESHFAAASSSSPAGAHHNQDLALAQEFQRREEEALRWREAKEFAALQAQYGMQQDDQGNFAAQADTSLRRAVRKGELSVTDYYEQSAGAVVSSRTGLDDGSSRTLRITPSLATLSTKSPGVRLVYVASPPVDHYASTFGDRGWGCGYRNLQMMISSLLGSLQYRDPLMENLLLEGGRSNGNLVSTGSSVNAGSGSHAAGRVGESDCPPMPSIPRLQASIEAAWRKGFDRAGADQLGNRLTNTRKWIGATEVYTLLTSCGLDARIIEFHRPTGEGGTHTLLFDWVCDYFSSKSGAVTTTTSAMNISLSASNCRPPLYLQHQGHSRTIVGVERLSKGSMKLLILDPSTSPTAIRSELRKLSVHSNATVGRGKGTDRRKGGKGRK